MQNSRVSNLLRVLEPKKMFFSLTLPFVLKINVKNEG